MQDVFRTNLPVGCRVLGMAERNGVPVIELFADPNQLQTSPRVFRVYVNGQTVEEKELLHICGMNWVVGGGLIGAGGQSMNKMARLQLFEIPERELARLIRVMKKNQDAGDDGDEPEPGDELPTARVLYDTAKATREPGGKDVDPEVNLEGEPEAAAEPNSDPDPEPAE